MSQNKLVVGPKSRVVAAATRSWEDSGTRKTIDVSRQLCQRNS